MNDHDVIRTASDVGLGLGGIVSFAWLPYVHGLSEAAGGFALYGGAALVAVRLVFAFFEGRARWRAWRK